MELELIRKLLYKWVDKIVEDLEKEPTETAVKFEPPTIIKIGETEAQPKAKTKTKRVWAKGGRWHKATEEEKALSKQRKLEYQREYRERNRDKIRKQQMERYYQRKAEKKQAETNRAEQWKHAGELFPKTNEDLVY